MLRVEQRSTEYLQMDHLDHNREILREAQDLGRVEPAVGAEPLDSAKDRGTHEPDFSAPASIGSACSGIGSQPPLTFSRL